MPRVPAQQRPESAAPAPALLDPAMVEAIVGEMLLSLQSLDAQSPLDAPARVLQRQSAIDAAMNARRRLDAIDPHWPDRVRELPDKQGVRISEMLGEISSRAAALYDEGERLGSRISAERDAAAREMASLTRGRAATGAYFDRQAHQPRYQDEEG